MGEPLLNLESVIPALRLIVSPQALAFSPRRLIVSTAGVIPGIEELGRADTGVNLAVSLNATTQSTRDHIMPGCKRWPLDALLEACRNFPLTKRRLITFEYVLLDAVNDTPEDRRRLVRLLHGIPCKVNLILYNPSPELALDPTPEDRAEAFRDALIASGMRASLRRSKGRRLQAACGQLAAHAWQKGKR
jgi:23S rRNA (adenine2503-C2)-methyltransferase